MTLCSRIGVRLTLVAILCGSSSGQAAADDRLAQAGRSSASGGPVSIGMQRVDPRNYRMVLAGNVITGLGGATFFTMLVGLVIRAHARDELAQARRNDDLDHAREARSQGRLGSWLAVSGGGMTAILMGTGVSLMAIGYRRERERRANLRRDAGLGSLAGPIRWVPWWNRAGGGIVGSLRF